MKAILSFLRTTLLGGILFLMPFVVIGVLLNKTVALAKQALRPVVALLPASLGPGPAYTTTAAIVAVAALCFVSGLLARTVLARRLVDRLETTALSKLPGYDVVKQTGASMLRLSEIEDYPVVLASLGGAWRIGVQTDVLACGLLAVFVPNAPNTFSGSVFLVEPERVRRAGVSLATALNELRRCGAGSGKLLAHVARSELA